MTRGSRKAVKKAGKYGPPRWATSRGDKGLAEELRKLGIRLDAGATRLPVKG